MPSAQGGAAGLVEPVGQGGGAAAGTSARLHGPGGPVEAVDTEAEEVLERLASMALGAPLAAGGRSTPVPVVARALAAGRIWRREAASYPEALHAPGLAALLDEVPSWD